MAATNQVLEREMKFDVPEGFEMPPLEAVANESTLKLLATYWDTLDHRLLRWGHTLRYRRASDGSEDGWTLKLSAPRDRPSRGHHGRVGPYGDQRRWGGRVPSRRVEVAYQRGDPSSKARPNRHDRNDSPHAGDRGSSRLCASYGSERRHDVVNGRRRSVAPRSGRSRSRLWAADQGDAG